jgi:predicted HTH domain antitoxin
MFIPSLWEFIMEVQIVLPDDIAQSLTLKWGSLEQKLLEVLVVEAYKEGSISTGKVRELLGLATRLEADQFLRERGVALNYEEEDFDADRLTHEELRREGLLKAL